MQLAELLQIIEKGGNDGLTCSIVAQLFAESPYVRQGNIVPEKEGGNGRKRYPIPHAHMHMRDGFEILPPPPTAGAARLAAYQALDEQAKKKVWEQSFSQLYPEPTDVQVYANQQEKLNLSNTAVGMDNNMLAFDPSYNRRSGERLDAVPAVTKTIYYVKVPAMGMNARPERVKAPNQKSPYLLESWRGTAYYDRLAQDGVCDKDGIIIDKYHDKPEIDTISPGLPQVNSNPHSMFEDGESAIMTLTAALKSTAGIRVLKALQGKPRTMSLAIQSRTSVRALHANVTANAQSGWNQPLAHSKRNSAVKMIDRTQQLSDKRQYTGRYDLTPKDITFTCTILSLINTNEVMIVTHYPLSGAMTNANGRGDCDLAEIDQNAKGGIFVEYEIDNPLPTLTW